MKTIVVLLLLKLYYISLYSQSLSQNSNYFISKTTNNKLFISSLDGLNIYDGVKVKQFKPSTHKMIGNNIQSTFYEDKTGDVWFTTYEALHVYHPRKDKLSYYFFLNEEKDTIKNDYRIISLKGDSLWMAADSYVFIFDVKYKKEIRRYDINLSNTSLNQILLSSKDEKKIITGYNDKLLIAKFDQHNNLINQILEPIDAFSLKEVSDERILIGDTFGNLVLYNLKNNRIEYIQKIYDFPISGIIKLRNNLYLLSTSDECINVFDLIKKQIVDCWKVKDQKSEKFHDRFLTPYLDVDSTLWIGVDGVGLVKKDLKREKFKLLLPFDENRNKLRITGIAADESNNLKLISTRGNGIYLIGKHNKLIHHNTVEEYAFNPYFYNDKELIFANNRGIYTYHSDFNNVVKEFTFSEGSFFSDFVKIDEQNYFYSLRDSLIYQFNISNNKSTSVINENIKGLKFVNIEYDGYRFLFASMNDQEIWVYRKDKHKFTLIRKLEIPGGILSLLSEENYYLITNTNGLFKVGKKNFSINHIIDRDKLLSQTLYSCIKDSQGYFWLSSNTGIIKYDAQNNLANAYKESHGLQSLEFNNHAFCAMNNGEIWMGGVNGLNYFNPSEISLATTKATVCIDDVQVEDRSTKQFGQPDYVENINLKFGLPFSLFFHAIDYGDIESARLKYKLIGSDKDFINVNDFKGNVRYPNLPPGHYSLHILAANSDGIWNKEPKIIDINILPPFWMTWWFITLMALSAIGLIYYIVKSYYKRKLEKQNILLREQALIIQAQQAIEKERNRIASEMHDDLGSGLTRIKYLSDKALQLSGQNEKDDVQKIANYSDDLVKNMSEIIWAMNSRFDNVDNLIAYVRRYASEYLEQNDIELIFTTNELDLNPAISGEKRRNVFLVIKEILHNAVKYSGAKSIKIHFEVNDGMTINISEVGGKGFDVEEMKDKSNGIYNMQKRMEGIGNISFIREANGMEIMLTLIIL